MKDDKMDERMLGVIKQEDTSGQFIISFPIDNQSIESDDKSLERQSVIENSLSDKVSDGTTLSVLHPVTSEYSLSID